MKIYRSLQATRFLAAAMVALFHLGPTLGDKKYFARDIFMAPFSFGDAGVEVFFVLSGFIIMTTHRRELSRPARVGHYLKKRAIRIYPPYWLVFGFVCILAYAAGMQRAIIPHDLTIFVKSVMLVPQDKSVVGGTGAPVLFVAWTLQYEVLFYLCFALAIVNWPLALLGSAAWLCAFFSFHDRVDMAFPWSFMFNDYIVLFFFGILLSWCCQTKIGRTGAGAWLFFGAFLFCMGAADVVTGIRFFEYHRVILFGLASSLLVFGLVKLEDDGLVLGANKYIQLLGNSSYALYLVHTIVINILCKIFVNVLHLNLLGLWIALVCYISTICCCFVAAVLFHLLLERPMIRSLHRTVF